MVEINIMNKPLFIGVFLVLAGWFVYDHYSLTTQIHTLEQSLLDRTNQQATLNDCITTSRNSHDIILESYFENTGTALYPDYKIDKETRDWLDAKLKNDMEFCQQEFSASSW